ncbi:RagB/SusD family nutrient uptake outer membrane protein [Sphingobacterium sp. SGG-5]|uniref:RagB/SusD family nutrient uptake outer membrane protein n=1 Tax=Sphingobacterium sp. SGG-5 TaxID=2710881 RepID=UPI0013ED50B3|nr:RagB/SusD family nutrient uptake outer membrane protein [Sphingobacterium sp. SGG-5]NGM62465.1 RagB/SusD family nutrient uptake outer membrane protein [Sphingobacterium sp. SGG-5]
MKRNIIFATAFLLSGVLFSCNDYLKTESPSVFTETTSFSNVDFAEKVLNGAYDNLASTYLFGSYFLWYNCDSDIEFVIAANNGGTFNIAHYDADEGISHLNTWWNLLYSSIERANICIDNLPSSPIWEGEHAKEAQRIYAEAKTIRALCYYELIKLFGDVPFKITSTQAEDNYYLPKTDRDEIYEYLIQDLKDAEPLLPWMRETNTTERVNKGFLKGLRARMALSYAGFSLRNKTHETKRGRHWEEYYQIANDECRELINSKEHALNSSFESVFKTLQSYSQDLSSKEVLFEIALGRFISGRIGYDIGMLFGYTVPSTKYGRGVGTIRTSPYYFYSFDTEDTRRNVSVELYTYGQSGYADVQRMIGSGGTEFRPTKWRKSWITPAMGGDNQTVQHTGVNWPVMRYADILLMYAETENEINNGPTEAAKDALKEVRKRAFPEGLWPSKVEDYVEDESADKERFFDAIVDERAWEFGGEMLRKTDLVRWNLLGPKLREMKEESLKIVNDDTKYQTLVPTHIFWRLESDGETIDILNPDYRLPSTAIPGYERNAWLPSMSANAKQAFQEALDNVAHGYNEAKNNHLYPINVNTITASNGVLQNDQMP